MNKQQLTIQIQTRVRMLDDVFHNAIIALERLEGFLINKASDKQNSITVTAVGTDRDKHDDVVNPPNEELMLSEMQLQCSALWFQTKTDGDERLQKTIGYFVEDLFSWYGGRKNIPFDEVEMFFVPLVGALSRQVQSVADVIAIVNKYVTDKIRSIDEYSDEDKAQAVEEGFLAWIKGQAEIEERKAKYEIEGDNFYLTNHKRSTALDGYQRLQQAMKELYPEDELPSKLLENIVVTYLSKSNIENESKTPDDESENHSTESLAKDDALDGILE